MKVYCKRNCIRDGGLVNSKIKWIKGKYYKIAEINNLDNRFNFYLIECEPNANLGTIDDSPYAPLNEKDFHRYFTNVDELRDSKIDEILFNR